MGERVKEIDVNLWSKYVDKRVWVSSESNERIGGLNECINEYETARENNERIAVSKGMYELYMGV